MKRITYGYLIGDDNNFFASELLNVLEFANETIVKPTELGQPFCTVNLQVPSKLLQKISSELNIFFKILILACTEHFLQNTNFDSCKLRF